MMTIHFADYVVFAFLLLISAIVGPYYMWRDRNKPTTSESYFVANRGLHFIPTAASLFASFYSAIAIIGIPAELYTGGAKFFMSIFGQVIGIALAAFIAVPVIYKLKLISTYEYLEMRFRSPLLRKLGTLSNLMASVFWLAVVTYAPCIALEAVSPIPVWASAVVTASITMIYTVLGGIKAVVLVDLIQAVVMFGGIVAVIVVGFGKIDGGFSRMLQVAREGGRLDFLDLNPDLTNTYNFWIMVIPPIFANAGVYATQQATVQRFSALPTVRQASWSIMAMAPQILILQILLFLLALVMFVHYDMQGCDPLRGGIISTPNQLTTFYVADILNYPGLVGVWFAALFSGSLSSMSTGYNSVAACIWEDLLKDKLEKKLTPGKIAFLLKCITLLLGISTCLIAAFLLPYLTGSVIKITNSTVNVFGAAIYIAFFCGALLPMTNAFGSVVGMIVATILISFIAAGQMYYRLGNEQVWLPTKTGNCSAVLASLISSGKWKPKSLPVGTNATIKAVTTGLLLLTAPSTLNSSNNAVNHLANITFASDLPSDLAEDQFLPVKSLEINNELTTPVDLLRSSGDGNEPLIPVFGDDDIKHPNEKFVVIDNATLSVMNFNENSSNFTTKNDTTAIKPWMTLPAPLLYLFSMSYFIFPFLALWVGFFIAIVVSLCTGGLKLARTIHPRLMVVKNSFYKGEITIQETEQAAESWYYGKPNNNNELSVDTPSKPPRRFFNDPQDYAAAHNLQIGNGGVVEDADDDNMLASVPTSSQEQPAYRLLPAHQAADDYYDNDAGSEASDDNYDNNENKAVKNSNPFVAGLRDLQQQQEMAAAMQPLLVSPATTQHQ